MSVPKQSGPARSDNPGKPTPRKRTPRKPAAPVIEATEVTVTTPPVDVTVDVAVDAGRVRKPLYAYVGAADVAIEKLKALPESYSSSLTLAVTTAQAQVKAARETVESSAQTATRTVRSLPATLPIVVKGQLETLPVKALGAYAGLAERGQKVVTSVRSNPAAKSALEQARLQARIAQAQVKGAQGQVMGAATSVRRAAGAAEKAAGSLVGKLG